MNEPGGANNNQQLDPAAVRCAFKLCDPELHEEDERVITRECALAEARALAAAVLKKHRAQLQGMPTCDWCELCKLARALQDALDGKAGEL